MSTHIIDAPKPLAAPTFTEEEKRSAKACFKNSCELPEGWYRIQATIFDRLNKTTKEISGVSRAGSNSEAIGVLNPNPHRFDIVKAEITEYAHVTIEEAHEINSRGQQAAQAVTSRAGVRD